MKVKYAVFLTSCLLILIAGIYAQTGTQVMNSITTISNYQGQDQSTNQQEDYKPKLSARGITQDGNQASFQVYEASDGIEISVTTEFYHSPAKAKAQLEIKVKKFSEIIEKNEIKDDQGGIRGERIVAKSIVDASGKYEYLIIYSSGNTLSYIESSSLYHVKIFENQFFKGRNR